MLTKEFKLTVKSQVTIPEDVKKILGIHAGDPVRFSIHQGHVEVISVKEKYLSVFDLGKKYRTKPSVKVSVEDMNRAIQQGWQKAAKKIYDRN